MSQTMYFFLFVLFDDRYFHFLGLAYLHTENVLIQMYLIARMNLQYVRDIVQDSTQTPLSQEESL